MDSISATALPASLPDVLARMNSSLEINELLATIMNGAKSLMQAEASTLWLYDAVKDALVVHTPAGANVEQVKGLILLRGKGIGWWVFENKHAYLTNNVQQDPLFTGEIVRGGFVTRNLLTVPLINAHGEAIGVLQVLNRVGGFSAGETEVLSLLAHQAAIAIERERLREAIRAGEEERHRMQLEQRDLQRQLAMEQAVAFARGVENERERIARELHDGVLGSISAVIRGLQPEFQRHGISRNWLEKLQDTGSDIRSIMENLRPRILEHFGLLEALESLLRKSCESTVPEVRFRFSAACEEPVMPDYAKMFLYRVFQEAAVNMQRHALASEAILTVRRIVNGGLEFILQDNGRGFDLEKAVPAALEKGGGNGILNMRHRINMLGGVFEVSSQPGRGTRLRIELPGFGVPIQADGKPG
jgi:signal transduction histidine kinase